MVFNLSLSNISKYRTELMGYAMIGVLIGHIIDLGHCEKTDLVSVLYWLCILIHTNGF